jgi:hypothetical protein
LYRNAKLKLVCNDNADTSAEFNNEFFNNPNRGPLDTRLDEAIKKAERCATVRESQGAKDEHADLDVAGTVLWNRCIVLARDSPGNVEILKSRIVRGGYLTHFMSVFVLETP